MNCKKNANSNPGEERQLFHPESEKVVEIGLERLRPFKNHPFKVKEDEAMAQLMESIERYGILNPLIVMPTREGVYQIVSGHRRKYCAEKLGYTQVPVIIRYMKEEDSIISMVDSNLHRDKILFSEKAFAYYMKNEAMKRKTGKRRRTQEGQLESIKGTKTIQLIGKETGESPRQVLRYIRLTLLVPELLDMLDEGKISFNPAVELSFLSEVEQKWVLNGMDYAQAAPSVSQAKRIKALSQEKKLTQQKINEILSEIKKSDMSRVIFKNSQMYKYFPRYYSAEQMKEEIIALLEKDYKRKKRQRKRRKRKPVKGLQQLIKTISMVKRRLNRRLIIEGILLTMVDYRTNYAKDVSAKVRETYGTNIPIFESVIPISVKAAEASAEGISIYGHCVNCKVATAYKELTKEVLNDGK